MNTTTTQNRISEVYVGAAMHRGVLTCERETLLTEVARTMADHAVHCVVVESGSGAGGSAASPIVMVTPAETLERAAQLMTEHGTAHLLVVDGPGSRPIGVLSTLDIASTLAGGE